MPRKQARTIPKIEVRIPPWQKIIDTIFIRMLMDFLTAQDHIRLARTCHEGRILVRKMFAQVTHVQACAPHGDLCKESMHWDNLFTWYPRRYSEKGSMRRDVKSMFVPAILPRLIHLDMVDVPGWKIPRGWVKLPWIKQIKTLLFSLPRFISSKLNDIEDSWNHNLHALDVMTAMRRFEMRARAISEGWPQRSTMIDADDEVVDTALTDAVDDTKATSATTNATIIPRTFLRIPVRRPWLCNWHELRHLELPGLGTSEPEIFAALDQNCPHLESLASITDNAIAEQIVQSFPKMFSRLKRLSLIGLYSYNTQGTQYRDKCLTTMLEKCPNLETIRIWNFVDHGMTHRPRERLVVSPTVVGTAILFCPRLQLLDVRDSSWLLCEHPGNPAVTNQAALLSLTERLKPWRNEKSPPITCALTETPLLSRQLIQFGTSFAIMFIEQTRDDAYSDWYKTIDECEWAADMHVQSEGDKTKKHKHLLSLGTIDVLHRVPVTGMGEFIACEYETQKKKKEHAKEHKERAFKFDNIMQQSTATLRSAIMLQTVGVQFSTPATTHTTGVRRNLPDDYSGGDDDDDEDPEDPGPPAQRAFQYAMAQRAGLSRPLSRGRSRTSDGGLEELELSDLESGGEEDEEAHTTVQVTVATDMDDHDDEERDVEDI